MKQEIVYSNLSDYLESDYYERFGFDGLMPTIFGKNRRGILGLLRRLFYPKYIERFDKRSNTSSVADGKRLDKAIQVYINKGKLRKNSSVYCKKIVSWLKQNRCKPIATQVKVSFPSDSYMTSADLIAERTNVFTGKKELVLFELKTGYALHTKTPQGKFPEPYNEMENTKKNHFSLQACLTADLLRFRGLNIADSAVLHVRKKLKRTVGKSYRKVVLDVYWTPSELKKNKHGKTLLQSVLEMK